MKTPTELSERQERLLRARISLVLSAELRRRPTDEELAHYLRVLCHAIRDLPVVTPGATNTDDKRTVMEKVEASGRKGGGQCL